MQYQSECLSALKSVANIHKPFEKAFMDTMKLFMAIPDRINFLQLGRYGCFSEQTYRNLFEHETFDWFAFNGSIISNIETLFKRQYIRRQRKNIVATPTGIELISLIKEELLKSAELTGLWERKLRLIEQQSYSPAQFIDELKTMVGDIVYQVLSDNSNRHVTQVAPSSASSSSSSGSSSTSGSSSSGSSSTSAAKSSSAEGKPAKPRKRIIRAGSICPECGQGKVIKGKTAYGCSRWKEGCNWRKPFTK